MADYKTSLSTEALVRSYPLGAFLKTEGSLDYKWWEKKNEKLPILFGLIKPGLTVKTSGVVNTISPFLEFYPISILGFFVRQAWTNRNMTEIGDFDCSQVRCKASSLSRLSYGAKLALGYKKIFFVTKQKWTKIDLQDSHNKNFVDEVTTMVAYNTGDKVYENLIVLGYKVNDIYSAGLFKKDNFMDKTNQQTRMHLAFISRKTKTYTAFVGAGAFRTRAHRNNGTILMTVKWPLKKGFSLF